MAILGQYLSVLAPMLVIDFVWLTLVARAFYQSQIGHLMTQQVNWVAAVIFYLIYAGAIQYFVVSGSTQQSLGQIALRGAVLGFVAYATYDLTNLATLRQWPVLLTVVDLVWGTVLTAGVAVIATQLTRWWN